MSSSPVFARPDTLLGVCQAVGDDLGFNPLWLRIALAVGVLWNPLAMLAAYAVMGVLVFASRMLFPARSRSSDVVAKVMVPAGVEPVYAKAA